MFLIDKFRDSRRPILSVLADPGSIFMSGLARFRRRTLYANITNDRSAVYYTTSISKTDPYTDLSKVQVHYVKGYEDVILDPVNPVTSITPEMDTSSATQKFIDRLPWTLALMALLPIGAIIYLLNSGVQTVRSNRRIARHAKGLDGVDSARYQVSLWIDRVQGAVEDAYESAYENLNNAQEPEFLEGSESAGNGSTLEGRKILARERAESQLEHPTLALAPEQFAMIRALDDLGWRKYPVWIHKISHSHAAIVERRQVAGYEEGQIVARHWVKEEFLM